jgi:hypothetical protein
VSILVVQLVQEGLLFGADRNITAETTLGDGTVMVTVSGQSQRPKVLKWPNTEVIMGYVGEARIEGKPTDQWLYWFLGRHLTFPDLASLAEALRSELDGLFRAGDFKQPLIVHLGGFEKLETWTPRVYFIRNTVELRPDGTFVRGSGFDCSEELSQATYFGDKTGDEIRSYLATHYFGFRQGIDLAAFGVLDQKLREAMEILIHTHPKKPHPVPVTLDERAKHVAFAINGYSAYFASFYPPFDQRVGGGADVVWAEWPAATVELHS